MGPPSANVADKRRIPRTLHQLSELRELGWRRLGSESRDWVYRIRQQRFVRRFGEREPEVVIEIGGGALAVVRLREQVKLEVGRLRMWVGVGLGVRRDQEIVVVSVKPL